MKSKLASAILNLERLSDAGDEAFEANLSTVYAYLQEIQDIEQPYYDRFSLDPTDMVKHAKVVGRLAATNMQAADPENVALAVILGAILNEEVFQILLAYAAKHFVILNLAEADARANEAQLQFWTLAPTQESQPNQDPPAEQPDEPQSAS